MTYPTSMVALVFERTEGDPPAFFALCRPNEAQWAEFHASQMEHELEYADIGRRRRWFGSFV